MHLRCNDIGGLARTRLSTQDWSAISITCRTRRATSGPSLLGFGSTCRFYSFRVPLMFLVLLPQFASLALYDTRSRSALQLMRLMYGGFCSSHDVRQLARAPNCPRTLPPGWCDKARSPTPLAESLVWGRCFTSSQDECGCAC